MRLADKWNRNKSDEENERERERGADEVRRVNGE